MIRYLFAFLLVLSLPLAAFASDALPAVTPIPDGADPTVVVPLVLQAIQAAQGGSYLIAAGLLLMVVTFAARNVPAIRDRVPKDYTALLLLATTVIGGFGAALASGADPRKTAIAAFLCSASAIALWEALGKVLVKAYKSRRSKPAPEGA